MKLCCAVLSATLTLISLPSSAADVKTVLAAARKNVESADYRVSGHLVNVDAGGSRTSSPITIKAHWFPGVLRVLVEIEQPDNAHRELRRHILLEMRPGGQSVIRIAQPGDAAAVTLPFEKWADSPLGPGFNFEDFLQQEYFWPGQTVLGETKYGARDCDLLKSVPGSGDRTRYSEVRTWLDPAISFPVHAEKTIKGSGAVKEFTYLGLRQDQGVWSAHQIEAKIRGQAGSTLLIIDHGSPKANLKAGDFSPDHLTHF